LRNWTITNVGHPEEVGVPEVVLDPHVFAFWQTAD